MIKHFAEFYFSEKFFDREEIREVEIHDPIKIAKKAPTGCYRFQLFDRVGEGNRQNISGFYYVGGVELTLDQLKEEELPNGSDLIEKMVENGLEKAVRTFMGDYYPLSWNDEVLQKG